MSPKNPVPGEVVEVQVDGEAGGVQQVGQSRRHRVATQLPHDVAGSKSRAQAR